MLVTGSVIQTPKKRLRIKHLRKHGWPYLVASCEAQGWDEPCQQGTTTPPANERPDTASGVCAAPAKSNCSLTTCDLYGLSQRCIGQLGSQRMLGHLSFSFRRPARRRCADLRRRL